MVGPTHEPAIKLGALALFVCVDVQQTATAPQRDFDF